MPRMVAMTPSASVGRARPASLWAYRIAATRRPRCLGCQPLPGAEWQLDTKFNVADELLRNPDFKTVLKAVLENGAKVLIQKQGWDNWCQSSSGWRLKALKLRLQLETIPLEFVVNEDNGEPYDDSTYRHWVSTARAIAVFGFLARDTVRQAIVRAERLMAELIRTVDGLFARFPLDEEKKARRARALDQRARVLAEWLDAQAARDSNGDEAVWRLKPCPSLMFVNGAGELDQKHDQDLRDTCVMLLDRAGCDLLTICDITGHSYRSAQTIVKHYRARNADRADGGIDRLELQVRKEGM
jgi:hypothetical protein